MKATLTYDEVIIKELTNVNACCDNMQYCLNYELIYFYEGEFYITFGKKTNPISNTVKGDDIFVFKDELKFCPFCGQKIEIVECI